MINTPKGTNSNSLCIILNVKRFSYLYQFHYLKVVQVHSHHILSSETARLTLSSLFAADIHIFYYQLLALVVAIPSYRLLRALP